MCWDKMIALLKRTAVKTRPIYTLNMLDCFNIAISLSKCEIMKTSAYACFVNIIVLNMGI